MQYFLAFLFLPLLSSISYNLQYPPTYHTKFPIFSPLFLLTFFLTICNTLLPRDTLHFPFVPWPWHDVLCCFRTVRNNLKPASLDEIPSASCNFRYGPLLPTKVYHKCISTLQCTSRNEADFNHHPNCKCFGG